jgi:hypothetical protein
MNSKNIFAGVLFGLLVSECSNTPPTATSTSNQNKPVEDSIDNRRLIYVTVLDDNNDTLGYETPFEMDSLFTSSEFQIGGHYTMNYITYSELSKHFINQDMAQIRIQNSIDRQHNYFILMRDFKKPKYQQFKTTYLKNIDWLTVDATQIGPEISTWGIFGDELYMEYQNANKKNYSYAEMHARWQLKHPNPIPFEQYMRSAKDSLFIRAYDDDTYVFTFGDYEEDAFHFHDLGIIADLNGDGIGDRAATWYYNISSGVCGITKKTPNGLIEFFEVEIDNP